MTICIMLPIKVDSFVTEANVHFPADYNLLWDSGRKCLDVLEALMDISEVYCKKKSFLFSNLVWNGFEKGRNTSR